MNLFDPKPRALPKNPGCYTQSEWARICALDEEAERLERERRARREERAKLEAAKKGLRSPA